MAQGTVTWFNSERASASLPPWVTRQSRRLDDHRLGGAELTRPRNPPRRTRLRPLHGHRLRAGRRDALGLRRAETAEVPRGCTACATTTRRWSRTNGSPARRVRRAGATTRRCSPPTAAPRRVSSTSRPTRPGGRSGSVRAISRTRSPASRTDPDVGVIDVPAGQGGATVRRAPPRPATMLAGPTACFTRRVPWLRQV